MDSTLEEIYAEARKPDASQATWEQLIRKTYGSEPHKITALLGIFDCKVKSGMSFQEAFDYTASAYLESIVDTPRSLDRGFLVQ